METYGLGIHDFEIEIWVLNLIRKCTPRAQKSGLKIKSVDEMEFHFEYRIEQPNT